MGGFKWGFQRGSEGDLKRDPKWDPIEDPKGNPLNFFLHYLVWGENFGCKPPPSSSASRGG